MSFQIEQANFTASEAEIITGINGDQQRNLRRHRYLQSLGNLEMGIWEMGIWEWESGNGNLGKRP